MNNIDPTKGRSNFFPNSRTGRQLKTEQAQQAVLKRNDSVRKEQLESISGADAKVQIPSAVKDFARIKKAVDMAPEIDNSARIAELKQQIQSGQYKVNYGQLADKILSSEV